MARFTRIQVVLKMSETGLVPLFYQANAEIVKKVMRACYLGGARVFEFTNRGDFAQEIFTEIQKYAIKEFPEMIVGVGSIMDSPTAAMYMQLGANFIVSPVLKEDIAMVCNRRKVLWMPGCGTLTEISRAEELGAEIVKLFPTDQTIGPDFVKSIKGPMPWTSIMPSGGIEPTTESIRTWFQSGVCCIGMGSNLITKEIVSQQDFQKLQDDVQKVLEIIQKVK